MTLRIISQQNNHQPLFNFYFKTILIIFQKQILTIRSNTTWQRGDARKREVWNQLGIETSRMGRWWRIGQFRGWIIAHRALLLVRPLFILFTTLFSHVFRRVLLLRNPYNINCRSWYISKPGWKPAEGQVYTFERL